MTDIRWPDSAQTAILFIVDASHRVEREILDSWLSEELVRTGIEYSRESVVVPIARAPEDIPIRALSRQLERSDDTLVIPVRVVWLPAPSLERGLPRLRDLVFGYSQHPGPRRAGRLRRKHPELIRCIAANPATLGELRERLEAREEVSGDRDRLADFVAHQAGLALDVAERRLRGGRYKVPRQVARNLKSSPRYKRQLGALAASSGRTLEELSSEVDRIMKELISIPSAFWIDVMGIMSRRIRTLGYDPEVVVDEASIERMRQISRDYPSVFLFTHKTHVDAFAHMSILYENDFPAPHILGGVNMAFAGLGFVLRRSGAIFIRRTFRDNDLYKMILRLYIGYLMEKRFPLSWAFEGTRSRMGKLMPPRFGLLKYVIEGAHTTEARNLHIIPVAINYDIIGDVKDYAAEEAGGVKRPESLLWFVSYLRGLRRPMGKIYLDFGKPVVLEQAPSPDDRLALSRIAFQVGVEVNRAAPITLPALASLVLLDAAPRALTRSEVFAAIRTLVQWCRQRDIRLAGHFQGDYIPKIERLGSAMIANNLITEHHEGTVLYSVAPEQHRVASYYRNTIVHYFVSKAIAELALLHVATIGEARLEAFWIEAERLRDLFKFEFFYAPTEQFRDEIREELGRYRADWEQALESEPGFADRFINQLLPLVAHATLLPYVEAYRVVSDLLARMDDSATLDPKDCINQALGYGRRAYLQRRISSEASIGKLLFENGYRLMVNLDLVEGGGSEVGKRRREQSRAFRELALRLDRVRVMARHSWL